MSRKIAINGFGRIGRCVLRILHDLQDPDLEVVAVNDLSEPDMLAHLLKYDSVHRTFKAEVRSEPGAIFVDGRRIAMSAEKDPEKLPWAELGVELVLECTGRFRTKEQALAHLRAGAKKVIISAPAKGEDLTCVVGVNDDKLDPDTHTVISCASCTTNCLAPVVKVLDDVFGVDHGLITTVHSYTNDQRLLDLPHDDKRRARAAGVSMVPSTTGAALAIGLVLPHLKGKLDGISIRVPTPDVSITDLVATLKRNATDVEVNAALKAAATSGPLVGILGFDENELVSSDYIGSPFSSVVDAPNTKVIGDRLVKVLAWYDNEWGFSSRMVDLSRLFLGLSRRP
ncbi:MAG: type I glyceraldehyde-3-phosphate dehydrogenase [Myxococcales bacterium]|nr:type I glyceraldehyde-3-phosphate dehydrogenase [Myxococcales bacterium]